jgi:hypothetical protein
MMTSPASQAVTTNTPAGRQAKALAALYTHLPAGVQQEQGTCVHTKGVVPCNTADPTYIRPCCSRKLIT